MIDKQVELNILYAKHKINFLESPLYIEGAIQFVGGGGSPMSSVMFVGEAPGKEEDLLGLPFVGRSGKFLKKIIRELKYKENFFFFTNILKSRTPNNRAPSINEIKTGRHILLQEIYIINPKLIITLGSSSLFGILRDKKINLTSMIGNLISFGSIQIFPLFHPSYAMRSKENRLFFSNKIKTALSVI